MNRIARGLVLGGLLIFLALSAFSFNILLVNWRLGQIDNSLSQISSPEDNDRSSVILGKMELLRLRADEGTESDSNSVLEARLQAIAADENIDSTPRDYSTKRSFAEPLFRGFVNLIRVSLGKDALQNVNTDKEKPIEKKLQQAYLWERARKYTIAIAIYQNIDSAGSLSRATETNVQIHLGYCLALEGKRSEARDIFNAIVMKNPGTDAGDLAQKMLFYLNYFEAKLKQDTLSTDDWLVRGRREFFLAEYGPAQNSLRTYLDAGNPEHQQEALYYLGRSMEELGQGDDAEKNYHMLIFIDRTSEWAKQAYRRLYFIGGIYGQKPAVLKEAKNYLEASGQSAWLSAVAPTAELIRNIPQTPKSVPPELVPPTTLPPNIDSWVLLETTETGVPVVVDSRPAGKTPLFLKVQAGSTHIFGIQSWLGKTTQVWHAPATPGFWERVRLEEPQGIAVMPQVSRLHPESLSMIIEGIPVFPVQNPHNPSTIDPQNPRSTSPSDFAVPTILSFSLGGVSLGALGVSLILGAQNYSDYKNSTNAADIARLRSTLTFQQTLNVAAGIISGLGAIAGVVFLIADNPPPQAPLAVNKNQ